MQSRQGRKNPKVFLPVRFERHSACLVLSAPTITSTRRFMRRPSDVRLVYAEDSPLPIARIRSLAIPASTKNAFTAEGRTKAENEMFTWLSRLLHWRQGNDVIIKGAQKQFIPYNGVYVIARQYGGKTVMTVVNGTKQASKLAVKRYAEVIGANTAAKDVLTGNTVSLSSDVLLEPRQTMILEF